MFKRLIPPAAAGVLMVAGFLGFGSTDAPAAAAAGLDRPAAVEQSIAPDHIYGCGWWYKYVHPNQNFTPGWRWWGYSDPSFHPWWSTQTVYWMPTADGGYIVWQCV